MQEYVIKLLLYCFQMVDKQGLPVAHNELNEQGATIGQNSFWEDFYFSKNEQVIPELL